MANNNYELDAIKVNEGNKIKVEYTERDVKAENMALASEKVLDKLRSSGI